MAELQRAIEWLEAEKASVQTDFERSDADWRMEYGVKETHDERMAAFDLAIQALRQMRSEPCEWCDGNSHKWLSVDPHAIGFDVYPDNYHKFCPNCGRPLPEPPEGRDDG